MVSAIFRNNSGDSKIRKSPIYRREILLNCGILQIKRRHIQWEEWWRKSMTLLLKSLRYLNCVDSMCCLRCKNWFVIKCKWRPKQCVVKMKMFHLNDCGFLRKQRRKILKHYLFSVIIVIHPGDEKVVGLAGSS